MQMTFDARSADLAPSTRSLVDGVLAAGLSAAVLLWRGRRDAGSAVAPINAVSHWLWPDEALRRDDPSWRLTGLGGAVHWASSTMWAYLYRKLREQRSQPTRANAVTDAVAVTALAAVVDLKVVPKRLSPGFEERISTGGLALVYAGFAIGLALGGMVAPATRGD